MKIAFQVEGPSDETTFPRLVGVLLGTSIDVVKYEKRRGGVGEVFRTLQASAWSAWRRGCRGMVVSVDCDSAVPHAEHAVDPADCRYCQVERGLPQLPSRAPEPEFAFAVGVPVRALEAWLLHFGARVNRRSPGPPHGLDRRDAKRLLWGAIEPSGVEVRAVLDRILPTITESDLNALAGQQPSFADFAAAVRTWK